MVKQKLIPFSSLTSAIQVYSRLASSLGKKSTLRTEGKKIVFQPDHFLISRRVQITDRSASDLITDGFEAVVLRDKLMIKASVSNCTSFVWLLNIGNRALSKQERKLPTTIIALFSNFF